MAYLRSLKEKIQKKLNEKNGLFVGTVIYLFGEKYSDISDENTYKSFLRHFESIMYFTYRKEFPPIANKKIFKITSDSGWGCMMRSGQMMLSNAFLRLYFDRNWRKPRVRVFENTEQNKMTLVEEGSFQGEYKNIIDNFYDEPDRKYSIHTIVATGRMFGKNTAEWFGPTTISNVFNEIIKRKEDKIVFYSAKDGLVIVEEIKSICMHKDFFIPIVIMIPIRLGADKINPLYLPSVQYLFRTKCSLGIIGGRPNHSLYFVGYQGDNFLYLDPHTVQKVSQNPETYHCKKVRKIKFEKIDPSMALGFFCKNEKEFREFLEIAKKCSSGKTPIFFLQKCKPKIKKLTQKVICI